MGKHTLSDAKLHTHHADLALVGAKFTQTDFFAPVHNLVQIKQKTVLHRPTDKLLDCLVSILSGSVAVSQSNTTLLADPALQMAFGRSTCADQSTLQRTLDATTAQNVAQLQQALALIFQTYSRVARHDFAKNDLILDIDMTPLPCSKTAQAACPGYFAGCKKGTSRRQLLRVSASQYDEIVWQTVLPGNAVCHDLALLQVALHAVWQILRRSDAHKRRIILRLDGGFGTAAIVNYLLAEGYSVVVKQFNALRSAKRARELEESQWQSELDASGKPLAGGSGSGNGNGNGRQFALLPDDGFYQTGERKLWQIAVRCPTQAKAKTKKGAKPDPAAGETSENQKQTR
jgi:Transposase DDE domain group 1